MKLSLTTLAMSATLAIAAPTLNTRDMFSGGHYRMEHAKRGRASRVEEMAHGSAAGIQDNTEKRGFVSRVENADMHTRQVEGEKRGVATRVEENDKRGVESRVEQKPNMHAH